jgi:small redox-active disulfide protein 2
MVIKVLGSGCPNCRALEDQTRKAAAELGNDIMVEKVDDITKIISYNILKTPALVIDEQVVLSGKVPTVAEIKALIQQHI